MWFKKYIYYLLLFAFIVIAIANFIVMRDYFVSKFVTQINAVIDQELQNKLNATSALAITIAKSDNAYRFLKNEGSSRYFMELPHYYRKYTKFKNIEIYVLSKKGYILFSPKPKTRYKKMTVPLDVDQEVFNDTWIDCNGLHLISYARVTNSKEILGFIGVESQFNSIVKNLEKLGVKAIALLDKELGSMSQHLHDCIQGYKILNYSYDPKFIKKLEKVDIERIIRSCEPVLYGWEIFYRYPIKDREGMIDGWIIYSSSFQKLFTDFLDWKVVFINILLVLFFLLMIYYNEKSKRKLVEEQANYYYAILDNFNEAVLIVKNDRVVYSNKKIESYFDDSNQLVESFGKYWKAFMVKNGKSERLRSWKEFLQAICSQRESVVKIEIREQTLYFKVKAQKIKENECVAIFIDQTPLYDNIRQLQEIAYKDPLTGAYNRSLLDRVFNHMVQLLSEEEHLLLVLIDLDFFKKINDTYGHQIGDEVLRYIVQTLKKHLRSEDYIFRVGGEEFLLLLKTKDVEKILQLLDEIRKELASTPLKELGSRPVTISIGVSEFTPEDTFETLFKRADEALYEAKQKGRNRLIFKRRKNDR